MIKLTIDPQGKPIAATYDKDLITIGDGPEDAVDICFPSEGLHKYHLKIFLKEGETWVVNQANDPFVTLNQQPFGKKKLQAGDTLKIRNREIRIDELNPLDPKQKESHPPLQLPILSEPQPVAFETVPPHIEEAYNLEEHKQPLRPIIIAAPQTSIRKRRPLFKAILFCSLTLLTSLLFLSTKLYFHTTTKIDREEMLAAESIADYAMALQYAKVYHIAPQKQNWVDPQFLKNNLVDLLSTTSLPCGNIDAQGQFSNCPYILRFYTNQDFSRFLLIAQPDAVFSQWILPKKTLIVDSSLMEIRKTDDLKTLNRLLSYPTPLDGANGNEVKQAISKMQVISLESLSKKTGKPEFSPPKALGFMKPGAENLIYNAPRYHQFGETFLKKALNISENRHSEQHNMNILQSELDTLAKFHDLVFYSSKGIKFALKGHKALLQLVLPSNFFTAYLIYSKEGNIINSRIIIVSDNPPQIADAPEEKLTADNSQSQPRIDFEADQQISLANLLRDQAEGTLEEIGPIIHNVYKILEDVIEKDSLFIPPAMIQLLDLYQIKQDSLRKKLKSSLESFKKRHPNVSASALERQLREYGLLDFYNAAPLNEKKEAPSHLPTDLNQEHWNAFNNLAEIPQKIKPNRALFKVKN